jgi:hypothetical protein
MVPGRPLIYFTCTHHCEQGPKRDPFHWPILRQIVTLFTDHLSISHPFSLTKNKWYPIHWPTYKMTPLLTFFLVSFSPNKKYTNACHMKWPKQITKLKTVSSFPLNFTKKIIRKFSLNQFGKRIWINSKKLFRKQLKNTFQKIKLKKIFKKIQKINLNQSGKTIWKTIQKWFEINLKKISKYNSSLNFGGKKQLEIFLFEIDSRKLAK